MNKVSCYGFNTAVSFLFFNTANELILTLVGVQNADDVWEGTIVTLDEGIYTVIAVSGTSVLGQEIIYWSGTEIVNQIQQLLEIYELYGLNHLYPLTVSTTERKTGNELNERIKQTIASNAGVTTVTRVVE